MDKYYSCRYRCLFCRTAHETNEDAEYCCRHTEVTQNSVYVCVRCEWEYETREAAEQCYDNHIAED